jgi:hypothetical protein
MKKGVSGRPWRGSTIPSSINQGHNTRRAEQPISSQGIHVLYRLNTQVVPPRQNTPDVGPRVDLAFCLVLVIKQLKISAWQRTETLGRFAMSVPGGPLPFRDAY